MRPRSSRYLLLSAPPTFPPPKQPLGPHTLVCPPRGLVPVRLAALPNSKTTSSTALGRRGSRCRHSSTCTQRLPGLPFGSTRFNRSRPSSPACGTGPILLLTSSVAVLATTAWKPEKRFRRSQGPVRTRSQGMQATKGLLLVSHNLEGSDRTHRLGIVEEPQYKSPCF